MPKRMIFILGVIGIVLCSIYEATELPYRRVPHITCMENPVVIFPSNLEKIGHKGYKYGLGALLFFPTSTLVARFIARRRAGRKKESHNTWLKEKEIPVDHEPIKEKETHVPVETQEAVEIYSKFFDPESLNGAGDALSCFWYRSQYSNSTDCGFHHFLFHFNGGRVRRISTPPLPG